MNNTLKLYQDTKSAIFFYGTNFPYSFGFRYVDPFGSTHHTDAKFKRLPQRAGLLHWFSPTIFFKIRVYE